ncbi:dynein light chain Tctex-type protein 2B-like [Haliotis cracherodii]|uniref:dynein light chain Tctex-type protein 2B-like n=1 Tax=Haliotis cracherodii TaxID=6455 RepID=UPI0039E90EA7
MSRLTMENLEQLDGAKQPSRRMSLMPRDGEGMTSGPSIRRMSRMIEPRQSVQYGRRMSHVSRSSISGASFGAKHMFAAVKIQNTFRLGPDKDDKFNASRAEQTMKRVLESYLDGEQYDNNLCNNLTRDLSEVIKARIKDLGFSHRYKFVCVVTMGENRNQGLALSSRSVWNTDTDNYASATYSKGNLFAVAQIYATYFE